MKVFVAWNMVCCLLLVSCYLNAVEPIIEWTDTYNSAGNNDDMSQGITVDKYGNVYVTGFENRSDIEQTHNIWIRKYDTNGLIQWTKTYHSPSNGMSSGQGIAVDNSGNVYVTGFEAVPEKGLDVLVMKYDANGLIQWTKTHNSPGNGVDSGQGIAVDNSGNVYVTGFEDRFDLKQAYNIWIGKYNANGLVQWTKTYNNASNNSEIGYGIAVDKDGNVYVTGYTTIEEGHNRTVWISKYDTEGVLKWTNTPDESKSTENSVGYGIAVDKDGNVYVAGYTTIMDEASYNAIWISKYDTNGVVKWTKKYSASSVSSEGKGIAVDKDGNVYVTGYVLEDMWIRKYDTNGLVQWTTTYNNPSDSEDFGCGIAVDDNGGVYVTGYENRSDLSQSYNIFVHKYSLPVSPALSWMGGRNYTSGGVGPQAGDTTTNFVYRVKYTDANNDAPKAGYPKVHIKKGDREITGSPFEMTYILGNNNTGAIYTYSITLSTGIDYTYYFDAYDVRNTPATGLAIDEIDGPEVSVYQKIQELEVAEGKFTCRIFTLNGEIIYEEIKNSISKKKFEWIPTNIASGIYIVSIEGSGIKIHKKVAIVRRY